MVRMNHYFNQLVAFWLKFNVFKKQFYGKLVDHSYSRQLFRPSYGCDLPSGLLNRVCRRSIRALVMWRLDTMGPFVDLQIIFTTPDEFLICF